MGRLVWLCKFVDFIPVAVREQRSGRVASRPARTIHHDTTRLFVVARLVTIATFGRQFARSIQRRHARVGTTLEHEAADMFGVSPRVRVCLCQCPDAVGRRRHDNLCRMWPLWPSASIVLNCRHLHKKPPSRLAQLTGACCSEGMGM